MNITTHYTMLLLLSGMLALPTLSAQTFQIGDVDGVNQQNQFPCPYGDIYEGMRAQYLYTAQEMIDRGASAGFISTVGFIVTDAGNATLENFSLRLSHTAATSLTITGWEPAGALVYTVADWQPIGGPNLHELQNQFYWDGTSNLLVEVCFNPTDPESGDYTTTNPRVAWSRNLPFTASRTYAADDEPGICATNTTDRIGLRDNRPVLLLRFSCQPPTNLTLTGVTSNSATVQFTASPDANTYVWEVGLSGFTPGTGTSLFGGVTSNTTLVLTDLDPLTLYDVYVRSNCGPASSPWAGPLSFRTLAGCGDAYYDSGGFLGAYQNNESRIEVLCADSANHVLTMEFSSIALAAGDTLRIYNGNSPTWPLMATLTGTSFVSQVFSATTGSGCLTVQFHSDSADVNVGWLADLTCGRPDSCFDVLEPQAYPVFPFFDRMGVRWRAMFDAQEYEWRAGVRPYLPTQPTSLKDTVQVPQTLVTGLTESTLYDFWVRILCKSGDSSQWVKVEFFTPPNCNAGVLNCGNSTWGFSSIGTGIYQSPVCNLPTLGKEKIIRFVAPNTRTYLFEVLSTNNTGTYVGYFYKPVSLGCGPEGWQCIEDFNLPGTESFGPLVAGQEYFIRFEPQNPAITVAQTVRITGCSPENDDAFNAVDITVDQACSGNVYSNEGAGISGNEPIPDANPGDGTAGRWQNGIERTVWFKFLAPASGTVKISTESVPQGSNFDTQVALYRVSDPNDYTTFVLLESDEDSGEIGLGFNAVMTYTGLTPGTTYYIQVDDYGTSAGTFCIEVLEIGERSTQDRCGLGGYAVGGVDGTQPNGDRWYNIYTVPSQFEMGDLVAAIKPGPQNLDSVWCQVDNIDTIPVDNWGQEYMPAYFNFRSKIPPVGPVSLRLFFYNTEFETLKAKANLPAATIEDLNATHYRGPLQDCLLEENSYANPTQFELITAVDGVPMGTSGTFYVELEVDSMGEVGVHLLAAPLPLELKSFTGRVADAANVLEWETLVERQVQWHVVERSADNVHWTEVGRRAGALLSDQALRYALTDAQPLARSYYRLRSIDMDGRTAYSSSILLNRPEEAFGIAAAFPSPTSGKLTLHYYSPEEMNVRLQVLDFTGRVVLEQENESAKGLNQWPLDLSRLAAGTWLLLLRDESSHTSMMRVVRH